MSLRPCLRTSISLGQRLVKPASSRSYAVQAPGNPTLEVFNRRTKWLQRERAGSNVELSRRTDYLRDEVAARMSDRMLDIKRDFDNVLDLGANSCNIANALTKPVPNHDHDYDDPSAPASPPPSTRIKRLTCVDESEAMLYRDKDLPFNTQTQMRIIRQPLPSLENLPYAPETFDAVLSSLSMHWINDLPSLLSQINSILKPDCPFIATLFGGDTLFELRTSLQLADMERRGGVTPRVSPLADVRDIGGLLQKAGFKLLTVDMEDIVVGYPDVYTLMTDLQGMGENNAILRTEHGPISRDVLLATEPIYRALHGEEGEGGIPATFRLIYMIGWKEGGGQAEPLRRGSGEVDLTQVLGGGKIA